MKGRRRHPFLEIADEYATRLRIDTYMRQHPGRFGGNPGLPDAERARLRHECDRLRDLARVDVAEGWPFEADCGS